MNGFNFNRPSTVGIVLPVVIIGAFLAGIVLIWLVISSNSEQNASAFISTPQNVPEQSPIPADPDSESATSSPVPAEESEPRRGPIPRAERPADQDPATTATIEPAEVATKHEPEPASEPVAVEVEAEPVSEPIAQVTPTEETEPTTSDPPPANAADSTTEPEEPLAKENTPFDAAPSDDRDNEAYAIRFGSDEPDPAPVQTPNVTVNEPQADATRPAEAQPSAPAETPEVEASPQAIRIATMRLRTVDRHRDSGDDAQAYRLAKQLMRQFPATPAAETARKYVEAYEADDAFMAEYEKIEQDRHRKSLLDLGENAFRMAQWKTSHEALTELVETYPDSSEAKQARELLTRVNRVLGN